MNMHGAYSISLRSLSSRCWKSDLFQIIASSRRPWRILFNERAFGALIWSLYTCLWGLASSGRSIRPFEMEYQTSKCLRLQCRCSDKHLISSASIKSATGEKSYPQKLALFVSAPNRLCFPHFITFLLITFPFQDERFMQKRFILQSLYDFETFLGSKAINV